MLTADWLLWLAAGTAVFWVADGLYLVRGMRSVAALEDVEPAPESVCPPATVCVPARNEAADLEEAVRSMLALDYPALEVIVVDDRSTDGTGRILDRMAREREPRSTLQVIHVEELPDGWLGKNHALQRAAEAASGELLLFTDADVRMSPDLLRRAVSRMEREGLDHLTAIPRMEWPSSFLRALGALMSLGISQFTEPWKLRDPSSPRHVGVGAFNLVRAEAYRRAGGHRAIARRPDDDLALAGILKSSGARAEFLSGRELMRVRWYRSLGEMVRGVGRSGISALGYSAGAAAAAAALVLMLHVWPWIGVVLTGGLARWANLVAVGAMAALFLDASRVTGARPTEALWWPAANLVVVWILVRAAVLVRLRGGIEWRGTFYSLEELKEETTATGGLE